MTESPEEGCPCIWMERDHREADGQRERKHLSLDSSGPFSRDASSEMHGSGRRYFSSGAIHSTFGESSELASSAGFAASESTAF